MGFWSTLYALIWTSHHCYQPDAGILTTLLSPTKLSIKKHTACGDLSVYPMFWWCGLLKLSITDILGTHVDTAQQ